MTLRAAVKERLARGKGLILLSDLDGTLAPIVDRPEVARLSRTSRTILARLARHPRVRVGIVSGRSLRDLKRLVCIPTAAYAGCYGLEIAWRGMRFCHPRAVALLPLLKRVTRHLRSRTHRFRGVLLEPKGLTVSLHYRLASPGIVPALKSLVSQVVGHAPGLEVLRGKKVLELRPRIAWGKGEAVVLMRNRLARSLGRPTPLTLYLGDDETDEEAFRALSGRVISVAVGRRRTRAAYRLSDPAAVQAFLAWLDCLLPTGSSLRRSGERRSRGSRGGGE